MRGCNLPVSLPHIKKYTILSNFPAGSVRILWDTHAKAKYPHFIFKSSESQKHVLNKHFFSSTSYSLCAVISELSWAFNNSSPV